MIKQIAYYHNAYEWGIFKPTGRWKLTTGPKYNGYYMFVENIYPDGSKEWIPEEHIEFRNERTEVVFEC